MPCKLCQRELFMVARAQILGKYDVAYYRCPCCGFTQTEEPYWLDDAYADAITRNDIGLVGRNIFLTRVTKAVITLFFDAQARFIDFGAGYGMLVRMLRDQGLNFYWHDKFCANLFAKGFEAQPEPGERYELLTAFEVFEHLPDPLAEIEQMLRYAPSVLFTTQLLPATKPNPGQWWYYGLEHGQHVAIYSVESLRQIARRFNCNLYTDGAFIHLLTPKRLPQPLFHLATKWWMAVLIGLAARRPSLLRDDYYKLIGKRLE
jgi:hypothetical protein